MTMYVPGSDQRSDLRVVRDDSHESGRPTISGPQGPEQALGLLENARRVADATVAEARTEAERLLEATRERAQQLQRDARELGQRLRADAERESAQLRHQAFGEAERIVADARAQVTVLENTLTALNADREALIARTRELVQKLGGALEQHDASDQSGSGQHMASPSGSHHAQG